MNYLLTSIACKKVQTLNSRATSFPAISAFERIHAYCTTKVNSGILETGGSLWKTKVGGMIIVFGCMGLPTPLRERMILIGSTKVDLVRVE